MNKTVLITGASSGIGHASAKLFAQRGWNVIATMRHPDPALDVATLGEVLVTRLDVSNEASIGESVAAGIARFQKIDVLINNAGYGQYGLFEAIPREKVQEQFDVNVFGVMNVTRSVLPYFRRQKSGVIINVSSGAGLFTLPMLSIYCASKFALEGFSEALAYELRSQNITIKLVIPHGGVTATRFSERLRLDSETDPSLVDYSHFVARTNEAFAQMGAASNMSSDDVAQVILGAATDGSDRLRYLVGDDARGFIQAWDGMSNEDYVSFMRSRFP